MSQRMRDVHLTVLSAVMTSFTFQMREWTGVRSSAQWPIGAAVLVMVVFLVIERGQGVRTTLLLASLIGIGFGISVASTVHQAILGKLAVPLPIYLLTAGCCLLYIRNGGQEQKQADRLANLDQRMETIRGLPSDQRGAAIRAQLDELELAMEMHRQRSRRVMPVISAAIAAGMLLTILSLPQAFSPEPKPVMIVLELSLLLLGCGWFTLLAVSKVREKRDRVPPKP